ncbi:isochorismatase family cysteine hydrolase [Paenibacillus sp. JX-17]|uniref:Isochorismatase family cysteine hydrolase n=1 Tax=Paenibacillus lacisoli TaxID=3064525 RepID=A0ABT9C911_9BACL|nr:isochorismatase family cysteine hydrolase [Paenibacillus sp. JX-17]MDO7905747.1 isochorismatase family cysteine hydrolase [Paenibacillus sp. JX-17]
MKALIVIDYTNDFMDGSLPVGEPAVLLQDTIAELTQNFIENGDLVVMAVDLHEANDPYHPETKLFPSHNIRGTEGRRLFGKLDTVYEQNKSRIYWMDKTRYSAFCGTDLELKLRERGIQELVLVGVCTDICVLHTAVDAYNKGYGITVYEDAVASFNQAGHEWALGHFKSSLGANVLKASQETS